MNWKFAYQANCWGDLGGNAEGVTSITKLHYRTFGDMDRAFAEIAAAGRRAHDGFDGVGRHGLEAVQIGPGRRNVGRMGKGHDKIQIGHGVGHPGRLHHILEHTGVPPHRL